MSVLSCYIFPACPLWYLAMDGDVQGGGLTGGYSATLYQCKNDCGARRDCNSFAHSSSRNWCKLMAEKTPTHPQYKDVQFCSKQITGTF